VRSATTGPELSHTWAEAHSLFAYPGGAFNIPRSKAKSRNCGATPKRQETAGQPVPGRAHPTPETLAGRRPGLALRCPYRPPTGQDKPWPTWNPWCPGAASARRRVGCRIVIGKGCARRPRTPGNYSNLNRFVGMDRPWAILNRVFLTWVQNAGPERRGRRTGPAVVSKDHGRHRDLGGPRSGPATAISCNGVTVCLTTYTSTVNGGRLRPRLTSVRVVAVHCHLPPPTARRPRCPDPTYTGGFPADREHHWWSSAPGYTTPETLMRARVPGDRHPRSRRIPRAPTTTISCNGGTVPRPPATPPRSTVALSAAGQPRRAGGVASTYYTDRRIHAHQRRAPSTTGTVHGQAEHHREISSPPTWQETPSR